MLVGDVQFDLPLSFSVFTHLSERCYRALLAALRNGMRRSGLLTLTVRPVEYWDVYSAYPSDRNADVMKRAHAEYGYAFLPHGRPPVDGGIPYGDASVSLEYIGEQWSGWEIVAVDYNLIDPYQVCVFLVPQYGLLPPRSNLDDSAIVFTGSGCGDEAAPDQRR